MLSLYEHIVHFIFSAFSGAIIKKKFCIYCSYSGKKFTFPKFENVVVVYFCISPYTNFNINFFIKSGIILISIWFPNLTLCAIVLAKLSFCKLSWKNSLTYSNIASKLFKSIFSASATTVIYVKKFVIVLDGKNFFKFTGIHTFILFLSLVFFCCWYMQYISTAVKYSVTVTFRLLQVLIIGFKSINTWVVPAWYGNNFLPFKMYALPVLSLKCRLLS